MAGTSNSSIKIGFLACAETLPAKHGGTSERRGDAFEHDLEIAALRPAFAEAGLKLIEIDWRAPISDFDGLALVLLGTAWDYQDHAEEFLARLNALASRGIIVCNAPEIVRWNIDKRYLRELAKAGVATIPTLWHDNAGQAEIASAMAHFHTDRVIVKRQIGAGALGQKSFTHDALPDTGWQFGHAAMIQPFLPAILDEGELTFVFIDGQFSHGVRKLAASGDYRIQSLYGGREEDLHPSPKELAAAQAVVDALPFSGKASAAPLYARVDMVRLENDSNGQSGLAVMETELIEPFLYPLQGPQLGKLLAKAICARL